MRWASSSLSGGSPDSTSADTASSAADLIGEWASVDGTTIWVVEEDTITSTFDGQEVISEYTATGTTLEFGNESGPMACPSFQPGTYEWVIEGDLLSLTMIDDDCGRAIALNGAVFERR